MPTAITSDPVGHAHAASVTNKRNISGVWTNHDDEQLKRARQQGHNWTTIAETYFPSKTPNACRKRHERLMEKINANGIWNPVKFEEVAKAYLDLREEMWRKIADRVNEKWTVVESKNHPQQRLISQLCFSAPTPNPNPAKLQPRLPHQSAWHLLHRGAQRPASHDPLMNRPEPRKSCPFSSLYLYLYLYELFHPM
ncbi:MAG: hypothetical protein Q9173_004249 [Seirophora scorigena]